jgi:tryptophanyl-tRNA synthetase
LSAVGCCCYCCCPCCHQINKYAFSGGGATLEEHRANGANLEVDVPWKYLNFFMEDDAKLANIGREYGAGRMLTGELSWLQAAAHMPTSCGVTCG